MPKDSYLPTEEDLQKIKDLDNGWEEVWDKICTELLGYDSKGRIHQAAKRYLRSHTSDYSECNCEDFASHIFIIFQEKVHNKKLFIAYDSDKSNGNVYGFLCNSNTLKFCYNSFRVKELGYMRAVDEETKKRKYKKIYITETDISGNEEDKRDYDHQLGDEQNHNIDFPEDFDPDKIVLKIDSTRKKFDRIESQAGLQLYRRLDESNEIMQRLTESVRNEVRSANVAHTNPDKTIRNEHELAVERLKEKIESYHSKLYDVTKQRYCVRKPKIKNDIYRKLNDADVELFVCPLDAPAVMRLLNVKRAAADQYRSRYLTKWKELFFSKEYIQEQNSKNRE